MKYYLAYKPFGMLTQFTDAHDRPTLANLNFDFPKDVYAVGRLDKDSEGLLLLTNNTRVNQALLHPKQAHEREYWVQVDGIPTPRALKRLREGIQIKTHFTLPAKATPLDAVSLPPREPPIRYRANLPTSWLSLILTEGKNRQVRRMTAKVGFPTLRLVRVAIEHLRLGEMQVGEVRALTADEERILLKQLKL